MKTIFFVLVSVLVINGSFASERNCKISTEDSGGFYELSNGRVDIISKDVLNRIDSNGDPKMGFKISEHDSLSCDSCIVRTKDPLISSFTVFNCMDARVEMCDRLENQNDSLKCSSSLTNLQKKQCNNWSVRADRFESLVRKYNLDDMANGRCKVIQMLYEKDHLSK